MYGNSILRTFDYPNTLFPQLVQIIEVPLYVISIMHRILVDLLIWMLKSCITLVLGLKQVN